MTTIGRLEQEHTPAAVAARLHGGPPPSYLRDLVYGAIDGAVTTFAVVAGAAGAGLDGGVVVVLGLLPFVVDALPAVTVGALFGWSAASTAAAFVLVGLAKGAIVGQSRWRSALEVWLVGGSAAGLA